VNRRRTPATHVLTIRPYDRRPQAPDFLYHPKSLFTWMGRRMTAAIPTTTSPAQENDSREALRRMNETLAVERDRMHAALGQSQSDLARQLEDWQQLHAMSAALLQARSLREQFEVVLRAVTRFHGAERGMISLYDPASHALNAQLSLGLGERGQAAFASIPVGAGVCGVAFQRRERVVVTEVRSDPLCSDYRDFAREEAIDALYSTPFYDTSGEPLGVLTVYFDRPKVPSERELRLTDICAGQIALFVGRERSQARAHREQQRSHHILQTLKDGFVLMDRDFRILQINAAGLAMDGRAEDEIVGRTHWDAWPGSQFQKHGLAYQHAMRAREPVRFENNYDYFGRDFWFEVYAYPYEDGLAVLYRDITQQKHAERERRASEARYRTLITSIDEGYFVIEMLFGADGSPRDYRFVETNPAFEKLTGFVEPVGKTVRQLVPGIEPHWVEIYGKVAASGEAIRMVEQSPTMGRWYDVYATRIGAAGEHRVAVLFKDITEQKEADANLRRLADDLARANQRQSEFLATLAHELRNPLAPIRTGLDLMRMNPSNTDALAKVRAMMERQTDHLIHLVNDLLDLARIRNGKIELKLASASLKDIVLSAVETTLPAIEARRHALDLRLPDEPVWVDADRNRLAQVIGNLLTNAARYTPEGGRITVAAWREGGEALVEVSDNGVGIPPASLPDIFDIFTQVGRGPAHGQGGLGIGLSLVKRLTEMHGGAVEAHSEGAGHGSRFTIRLPALEPVRQKPPLEAGVPADAAPVRAMRILLADDNHDAVEITRELLDLRGHAVEVAHDGREALALAQARLPDVALLDIGMPGMSGYELAAALRRLPGGAAVRLVALTGWGTEQDRARTRAAGFDLHLTKPIDLRTLDGLLAAL
jgi:PAS domain S-box-containing protein